MSKTHTVPEDEAIRGRPIRTDRDAESADPALPAFLARPEGAPVYHGFPTLAGVEVDGFRLGMITDWLSEPDRWGDGFVIAPDGSRAGIVWESEADEYRIDEVLAPDSDRWGVWGVVVPLPLRKIEDATPFLAAVVPDLKARWKHWRSGSARGA